MQTIQNERFHIWTEIGPLPSRKLAGQLSYFSYRTAKFFGLITQDDLRRMVEAAKNCNVNFIWAAHPGLQQGISFSNTTEMNKGIDALMTKFEHIR